MSETPRPWDRLPTETTKSYAGFCAYIDLGATRSIREAARQNHGKTTVSGKINGLEKTMLRTWESWSARHKWVSRANARDEWLARVSDEQIKANFTAFLLDSPRGVLPF